MAERPFDVKTFNEKVKAALVSATRAAGQVAAQDISYERNLDPAFGTALETQNGRILELAQGLLQSATAETSVKTPALRNGEDLESNWKGIVDSIDLMLEKTDICLDEYTGLIKRGVQADDTKTDDRPKKKQKIAPGVLGQEFRTQNMVKPQILFCSKPDNFDPSPFKPILTSKPHATVPLEDSLVEITGEDGTTQYQHPYLHEITQLEYPEAIRSIAPSIKYSPIELSKATFVDTPEKLAAMLMELKKAKEIAVDLEHHDTRSYVGLVSLMQISTRHQDWIIDTLKPWRRDLQVLNEVFADPSIVKVFQGAYMDIVWLQRDLGLYIVGLFDTYHASRRLGYPRASLAALLERFTDFVPEKKYQMADWRIRPLPLEMQHYARADTHFLLYIYDELRNNLVAATQSAKDGENPLEDVLSNSRETSLLRYEKFVYDSKRGSGTHGWYKMIARSPGVFKKDQWAVFRTVHEWRDTLARKLDEGLVYLIPHQTLTTLARIIPTDLATLSTVLHKPPNPINQRKSELLEVILAAKEASDKDPEVHDFVASLTAAKDPGFGSVVPVLKTVAPEPITEASTTNGAIVLSTVLPSTSTPQHTQTAPLSLRTHTSQFWGPTLHGQTPNDGEPDPTTSSGSYTSTDEIRLVLPLPPLTAEVFCTESTSSVAAAHASRVNGKYTDSATSSSSAVDPGARAHHEFIRNPRIDPEVESRGGNDTNGSKDDVFVIKNSRRGKSGTNNMPQPLLQPEGNDDDDDQEVDDTAKDVSVANGTDPEAFDYANATSVLHAAAANRASQGRRGRKKGDKQTSEVFDPYLKSMDAPKGMARRREYGGEGKSRTFRS